MMSAADLQSMVLVEGHPCLVNSQAVTLNGAADRWGPA